MVLVKNNWIIILIVEFGLDKHTQLKVRVWINILLVKIRTWINILIVKKEGK